MRKNTMTEI